MEVALRSRFWWRCRQEVDRGVPAEARPDGIAEDRDEGHRECHVVEAVAEASVDVAGVLDVQHCHSEREEDLHQLQTRHSRRGRLVPEEISFTLGTSGMLKPDGGLLHNQAAPVEMGGRTENKLALHPKNLRQCADDVM